MSKNENKDFNSALKFVWAYMLKEGTVTSGEWSYYGGRWEYLKVPSKYHKNMMVEMDWRDGEAQKQKLLAKVKEVGINWSVTKTPCSSQQSSFEGTFNDSSRIETLLGTVVLNDGTEYRVGVGNTEKRFSDYVQFLNAFMEDKQMLKDILGEQEEI